VAFSGGIIGIDCISSFDVEGKGCAIVKVRFRAKGRDDLSSSSTINGGVTKLSS
jgi:hypothetical protein